MMGRSHWLLFVCYLLVPVALYGAMVTAKYPPCIIGVWLYYGLLLRALWGCSRLPGGRSFYRFATLLVASHLLLSQIWYVNIWKGVSDSSAEALFYGIFVVFVVCCWAASGVAYGAGRRVEAGLHFLTPAFMVGGFSIAPSVLLLFFVQGFRAAWLSEQILAQPEAKGTGISPV